MTWTTDESSIKVVEVKSFVDKNPTLYKKRAKAFAEQGSITQSLKEYDTAIKYSGNSVSCCLSKLFFCMGNNQTGAATAALFKTLWVIVWHKLRPFWFWIPLIGIILGAPLAIGIDLQLILEPLFRAIGIDFNLEHFYYLLLAYIIPLDFINVVSKSFKLNRRKYTIHFLGALSVLLGVNYLFNFVLDVGDFVSLISVIIQLGAMIYMGVVGIKMVMDIVKYLSTKGNRLYIDEG